MIEWLCSKDKHSFNKGDTMSSIKDLTQGAMFEFKGQIWEVIGASVRKIQIRSENGDISSVPVDCEIKVNAA